MKRMRVGSNGFTVSVEEDEVDDMEEVQSELKNWTASAENEFNNAVEIEREYKFTAPPHWTCILCNETIRRGSIIQCHQGHLACSTCAGKGGTCEVCSNDCMRNVAVEEIRNSTVATCKFATLGCTEVIEFRDLESCEHEKTCLFAPMVCPMPDCHQAGVTKLFSQHLLTKHNISLMVDLQRLACGGDHEWRLWRSKEFEIQNAFTDLVLLRELGAEFHLLHQEITHLSDKLYVTSLSKSPIKRQYDLEVKIGKDVTFSLKSNFDKREGEPKILIPIELGGQKTFSIRTWG